MDINGPDDTKIKIVFSDEEEGAGEPVEISQEVAAKSKLL